MKEKTTETYINQLELEFKRAANHEVALQQQAYMKHNFKFFGIKTVQRRSIQKPFLDKRYLPTKSDSLLIVKDLWDKDQREFQYFGQELMFRYVKHLNVQDIKLLEFMVEHKSWWDTVDFIAVKLMGHYFKLFPEQKSDYINGWINSKNIWLMRSALLFQLKYKDNLDTDLMSFTINSIKANNQFFINKAIGWILREYSKTDADWVLNFVDNTKLSNLSKREALRLINK